MSLATAVDIAKLFLVITFLAVTISLVTYSVTATWWKTVMGRAIVTEQSTMFVVIGFILYKLFWPGTTPLWVSLLLYGVIMVGQVTFMGSIWWAFLAHRRLDKGKNGYNQANA